ncbi:uncharacterized protein FOMMEDRAFT_16806 [Fomitiporia mediterranea MF3/22]|uniref:uncharacterized protein n=1 Tax=Fomitiporia mediterranea (strain MF3/22) TaxID=694068 RepID=UPI0004408721|nr:uncharacterized protein FOMMEDRAFT_16806 [Fomitiporia mediterranea MF3/22]EJD08445.1 hypothetical protein FOMMEDRAFT_16806 [Fomitiporia mediterranea MF3/22]
MSRRSPIPTSRSSAKQTAQQTQSKKTPAELVTYRLDQDMVYVQPAHNFEEALNYAQSVFPQLCDVPRSRIAFAVNVRVNGVLRTVRIAPMAWPRVLRSLATYEIIDISILPCASSPVAATRFTKSETELATSVSASSSQRSFAVATSDEPPKYGNTSGTYGVGYGYSTLGLDLYKPTLDVNKLKDSEKSPNYTLLVPEPQSPSPVIQRCASAFSWFSKRL